MCCSHYGALCRPTPSKSIAQILLSHYFVRQTANFPRSTWLVCSCSLFRPEYTTAKIYSAVSHLKNALLNVVILIVVSILVMTRCSLECFSVKKETVVNAHFYAASVCCSFMMCGCCVCISASLITATILKTCRYMMRLYFRIRLWVILFLVSWYDTLLIDFSWPWHVRHVYFDVCYRRHVVLVLGSNGTIYVVL